LTIYPGKVFRGIIGGQNPIQLPGIRGKVGITHLFRLIFLGENEELLSNDERKWTFTLLFFWGDDRENIKDEFSLRGESLE
jgi:hypothetical protein